VKGQYSHIRKIDDNLTIVFEWFPKNRIAQLNLIEQARAFCSWKTMCLVKWSIYGKERVQGKWIYHFHNESNLLHIIKKWSYYRRKSELKERHLMLLANSRLLNNTVWQKCDCI